MNTPDDTITNPFHADNAIHVLVDRLGLRPSHLRRWSPSTDERTVVKRGLFVRDRISPGDRAGSLGRMVCDWAERKATELDMTHVVGEDCP